MSCLLSPIFMLIVRDREREINRWPRVLQQYSQGSPGSTRTTPGKPKQKQASSTSPFSDQSESENPTNPIPTRVSVSLPTSQLHQHDPVLQAAAIHNTESHKRTAKAPFFVAADVIVVAFACSSRQQIPRSTSGKQPRLPLTSAELSLSHCCSCCPVLRSSNPVACAGDDGWC